MRTCSRRMQLRPRYCLSHVCDARRWAWLLRGSPREDLGKSRLNGSLRKAYTSLEVAGSPGVERSSRGPDRKSVELPGVVHNLQGRLCDLQILGAGPRTDADRTDDTTIDNDRQAPGQVDAFTLGRNGKLEIDTRQNVAGRFAVGGRRLGF